MKLYEISDNRERKEDLTLRELLKQYDFDDDDVDVISDLVVGETFILQGNKRISDLVVRRQDDNQT